MTVRAKTQQFINLLLAGKHPQAKKFAGQHVMVVENKILPVTGKKKDLTEMAKLEKKYGQAPTIVFIPQPGTTYILVCHG